MQFHVPVDERSPSKENSGEAQVCRAVSLALFAFTKAN